MHLHRESRTTQLFGTLASRVDTADRVAAPTFDDGPTSSAIDEVLAVLARRDVRASVIVNGAHLAEAPQLARRLVAAGHELEDRLGAEGYRFVTVRELIARRE